MFRRTVAAFLSLVLVGAGFATQGNAASLVLLTAELDMVHALDSSHQVAYGSVDDHHLDDPPGSASVEIENLADQPDLLVARPGARAPLLAMTRPHPYLAAAFTSGHVETPQRPPNATSSVA